MFSSGAVIATQLLSRRTYYPPPPRDPGYWPEGATIHTPGGPALVTWADGDLIAFTRGGHAEGILPDIYGKFRWSCPEQGIYSGFSGPCIKRRPRGFSFARGPWSAQWVRVRWELRSWWRARPWAMAAPN
jgi:hypothetical protein